MPDAASALPTVSPDGRTYTFQIRPGIRFSPPSGEELTADTFRRTIERTLSPKAGPDPVGLHVVDDIVGARAFHAGRARHISGIVARGDQLTITLTRADGRSALAARAAALLRGAGRHARPGLGVRADRFGGAVLHPLPDRRGDGARPQPELPRRAPAASGAHHLSHRDADRAGGGARRRGRGGPRDLGLRPAGAAGSGRCARPAVRERSHGGETRRLAAVPRGGDSRCGHARFQHAPPAVQGSAAAACRELRDRSQGSGRDLPRGAHRPPRPARRADAARRTRLSALPRPGGRQAADARHPQAARERLHLWRAGERAHRAARAHQPAAARHRRVDHPVARLPARSRPEGAAGGHPLVHSGQRGARSSALHGRDGGPHQCVRGRRVP